MRQWEKVQHRLQQVHMMLQLNHSSSSLSKPDVSFCPVLVSMHSFSSWLVGPLQLAQHQWQKGDTKM